MKLIKKILVFVANRHFIIQTFLFFLMGFTLSFLVSYITVKMGLSWANKPIYLIFYGGMISGLSLMLVFHNIRREHMTYYNYEDPSSERDSLQQYKIVISSTGEIVKIKNNTVGWGQGEEYTFSMPADWKDEAGAVNELLVLFDIPHENESHFVPVIVELKMKQAFPAIGIIDIITSLPEINPLGMMTPGIIGAKHLNLQRYYEESFRVRSHLELKGKLVQATKGVNSISFMKEFVALLQVPEILFNIESFAINIEKSADKIISSFSLTKAIKQKAAPSRLKNQKRVEG